MSSLLWIPCFNEGTQHTEFPIGNEICSGNRHAIYETLQLMNSRINAGLFKKVIITNDGSRDDTLDGIRRFKKENKYRSSVFQILNRQDNVGKMQRFFEAFDCCDEDIFVMTDADMVSAGGDTFNRLTEAYTPRSQIMRVHEVGEALGSVYDYSTLSSGTRSLLREKVLRVFRNKGIGTHNLPGQGYGLEMALNYYLGESTNVLQGMSEENTPRFLESFRKDRTVQWEDKDRTYERITEIGCIK